MTVPSLYHAYRRIRTLQTHRISALPIVILMPHSACNCRCVMCDIWKGNSRLRQLTEEDVAGLLESLKRMGTREVVMSGGEALLHPLFFRFCALLKTTGVRISLLSTGLSLRRHADDLLRWIDSLVISLDGDAAMHDAVRNISGAYEKLSDGVRYLKSVAPSFRITSRTVIHRLNYERWTQIIDCALEMGIDQVSFLPADVSSAAFNRETRWDAGRQSEIALHPDDLPKLEAMINTICSAYSRELKNGFIAENEEKLKKIHTYYSALLGRGAFPFKQCNAPWVSTVINPDGSVQPCFFHPSIGNIRDQALPEILNGAKGLAFRKGLDMEADPTCKKCVCYLNLPPKMAFKGL